MMQDRPTRRTSEDFNGKIARLWRQHRQHADVMQVTEAVWTFFSAEMPRIDPRIANWRWKEDEAIELADNALRGWAQRGGDLDTVLAGCLVINARQQDEGRQPAPRV